MAIDILFLNGTNIQSTLGFYLDWRKLSAPEPQIDTVVIPASNKVIDLTETFGEVYYNQRKLDIGMTHPGSNWIADYEDLLALYHGQDCQIKFNNDPNWYWTGRVIVGEYDSKTHKLSMSATVFPYKLYKSLTTVSKTVNNVAESNAQDVILTKSRMRLSPKVTVTATGSNSVSLKWTVDGETKTQTLSAGTYYVRGLKVGNENVTISVWGTGTVNFEYRRGTL